MRRHAYCSRGILTFDDVSFSFLIFLTSTSIFKLKHLLYFFFNFFLSSFLYLFHSYDQIESFFHDEKIGLYGMICSPMLLAALMTPKNSALLVGMVKDMLKVTCTKSQMDGFILLEVYRTLTLT